MEKCSLCAQRIQVAKAQALQDGREMRDGEFRTACEQSCPSDAIVSGNLNDPECRISRLRKDPRYFGVLTEMGTQPSVGYLTLVRNRPDGTREGEHHG